MVHELRGVVSETLRPVAEACGEEAPRSQAAAQEAARCLVRRLRPMFDDVLAGCDRLQEEIDRTRRVFEGTAGEGGACGRSSAPPACGLASASSRDCAEEAGASREASSSSSVPLAASAGPATAAGPAMVILNCANLGHTYTHERGLGQRFDWEGVRKAIRFYDDLGVASQGVCKRRTAMKSPVPADLKSRVVVCPTVDDDGDADDLYTIRMAMHYGCHFVDNDNYRDWKRNRDKSCEDVQEWLSRGDGAKLKVTYIFDYFGRFIPSMSPPAANCRSALQLTRGEAPVQDPGTQS